MSRFVPRFVSRFFVALAVVAAASTSALAQTYPAKPIRWILGYPPGGGTEFIARTVAHNLSAQLGQPIVIENRPGAAAIIGAEAAARSTPDGYTLFMADNGTFVYHLGVYKKLPYDPNRDFIPVGMIVRGYMILLTGPSGPKSVAELVELARRNPGKLNNASNGSGTAHHLAAELLKQRAGIEVVNIPFKGTAAVMQELMSERIIMGFADISAARGALAGGKVRALAVAAKQRLAALPEVPTFAEVGFPDFEVFFWQGIAVPAGTPRDIVERLSAELQKTLAHPDVQKRLTDVGMEVLPTTSEQMAQQIRSDQAFWVPLIRKLGITVD
ncbi:MAG TPA: tripartite tricarboxylate transporter substrate binding protein [Burkholderiales bacterium]|nr:tripartite tricarboxylate transporter substrate binding protein [Burkholderiales bacterium]